MSENTQRRRIRECSHLVLAAFLLLAVSCQKYTRYAPGTWSSIDYSESEYWRLETSEEVYLARRVATTDSSIIIEELSKNDKRYKVAGRKGGADLQDCGDSSPVELPIALSFEEVSSIERIDHDRVKEGVLVVGLTAVAILAVLAFESWVFAHADWD